MAYSDFTLTSAVKRLGLRLGKRVDLLGSFEPVEVSPLLKKILETWAPHAIEVNTEKARSELIVAPILMEAAEMVEGRWSVFSGVTMDVDRERGLFGRCDFLIGPKAGPFLLGTPLLAVVEAKNDDIAGNLGQCVAEMVAVGLLNDRNGDSLRVVHGCVTTGSEWLFLKLEANAVTFDIRERPLGDVAKILAYLAAIEIPEPGSVTPQVGP